MCLSEVAIIEVCYNQSIFSRSQHVEYLWTKWEKLKETRRNIFFFDLSFIFFFHLKLGFLKIYDFCFIPHFSVPEKATTLLGFLDLLAG